jgi:hypothetical protein
MSEDFAAWRIRVQTDMESALLSLLPPAAAPP